MNTELLEQEHRRLLDILDRAEVSDRKKAMLAPVIDNMAWQRAKLDEARAQIQEAPLTLEYNNGGGQTGTREHPGFKAYVALWRAYMIGWEKYSSCLPEELKEEAAGDANTTLAEVLQMRKNA